MNTLLSRAWCGESATLVIYVIQTCSHLLQRIPTIKAKAAISVYHNGTGNQNISWSTTLFFSYKYLEWNNRETGSWDQLVHADQKQFTCVFILIKPSILAGEEKVTFFSWLLFWSPPSPNLRIYHHFGKLLKRFGFRNDWLLLTFPKVSGENPDLVERMMMKVSLDLQVLWSVRQ